MHQLSEEEIQEFERRLREEPGRAMSEPRRIYIEETIKEARRVTKDNR